MTVQNDRMTYLYKLKQILEDINKCLELVKIYQKGKLNNVIDRRLTL